MNILKFSKHSYLSNYFKCNIVFQGNEYGSSEALFQAMKLVDPEKRKRFEKIPPHKAKALGRKCKLRADWEKIKIDVMRIAVYEKFTQNLDLKIQLLSTGNMIIIEDTTPWKDTFWGQVNGVGKNWLGKILVETREIIRTNQKPTIKLDIY